MMRRPLVTVVPLACMLALILGASGCSAPSPWERTFVREPGAAIVRADAQSPVRVRGVPWERMGPTLAGLQKRVVESDVPPEEWSFDKRRDATAELLRGLQVSADPSRVSVLGRCEFRTTDTFVLEGADAESISRFARSIGATDAVYAARSLGKADKIIERPVSTWGTTSVWGDRSDRRGTHWWDDSYTHSSTTWVPIKVEAEETGYVVFFLRIQ